MAISWWFSIADWFRRFSLPAPTNRNAPAAPRRRPVNKRPLAIGKKKRSRLAADATRKQMINAGSQFFKLPAEIRIMIYNLAIPRRVHVRVVHRKKYSFPLYVECQHDTMAEGHYCSICSYGPYYRCNCPNATKEWGKRPTRQLLALQTTCRQMHEETISLLYRNPLFIFHNPGELYTFAATIPKQHLSTIRSLRLDFPPSFDVVEFVDPVWKEVCTVIASMHGLQRLVVDAKLAEDPRCPADWLVCDYILAVIVEKGIEEFTLNPMASGFASDARRISTR
ncbi:hypothetical protein FQN50_009590 [Emmonsiellopsis sp. PD_5]|nr:hypothetical protein FQN50_009590 [Emmonsiellopsis sp. PD_5]